jgi:succinoglycan biosynthesis transport protein ExoP
VNLYLLLSALRARYRVFFLVLLATVLVATVVSLLLPKTYVATASLLVDAKNEQSMTGNPFASPRQQIGYLQTQVDLISSMKVARKVVADLRLADSPAAREAFEDEAKGQGSIEDWLAENLLRYLKVDTSQSSVIQVMYGSSDPKFSAAVVNAFAKSYMDTHLELRVEPTKQAAVWFDEALKGLRTSLEQAQTKLSDYQRQKGIVSSDERSDVDSTRLAELSSQLVQAQNLTYDARTRQQQAREFLNQGIGLDKVPEVLSNPFIQSLKTQLSIGEARLQDLASQYGRNYPLYQRQMSENQSVRERLDSEMRKIVDGLENAARQSSRREAELKDALGAQRSRVLEFKEYRNELGVLARDLETAQRAYDTALQRLTVNKVESSASQTNVAVLNSAVEPRNASRPKIFLNIALAAFVGTVLGLAIVFLMETFDRRVRSFGDLDDGPNVPVLVVLNSWEPARARLTARLPGVSGGGYALPSPT